MTDHRTETNPPEEMNTGADTFGQWLTIAEAVAYCATSDLPRTPKTVRRWAARAALSPTGEAELKVQHQDTENGFRWLIDRDSLDVKIAQENDFEARARTASGEENMSGQVITGADTFGHVLVAETTTEKMRTHEDTSAPLRTGADRPDDGMIEFLKKQIEVKDQQIAVKDQQIVSMLERDRETNILIQGLQTNLARVAEALPSPHRDNRNSPQRGDNSAEAPMHNAVQ